MLKNTNCNNKKCCFVRWWAVVERCGATIGLSYPFGYSLGTKCYSLFRETPVFKFKSPFFAKQNDQTHIFYFTYSKAQKCIART